MDSGRLVVAPGSLISREPGHLKGHGTYFSSNNAEASGALDDGSGGGASGGSGGKHLVSSAAGAVERVNKLISVKPAKTRCVRGSGGRAGGRRSSLSAASWPPLTLWTARSLTRPHPHTRPGISGRWATLWWGE